MTEKVAIILAAGVSSRMNTRLPKVLHEVCGRPMLAYVLDAFKIFHARAPDHAVDLITLAQKKVSRMGADESGATSDQDGVFYVIHIGKTTV